MSVTVSYSSVQIAWSRASDKQLDSNHSLLVLEFGGLRGVNSLKGVAPDKVRACPWPWPLGVAVLFWPATAGAVAVLLRVLIFSDNGRLFLCERKRERKKEEGLFATG